MTLAALPRFSPGSQHSPQHYHNALSLQNKKDESKKKETWESSRQRREDAKYDALPESEQFDIADRYVTFC
jgi:hypothetical protein